MVLAGGLMDVILGDTEIADSTFLKLIKLFVDAGWAYEDPRGLKQDGQGQREDSMSMSMNNSD